MLASRRVEPSRNRRRELKNALRKDRLSQRSPAPCAYPKHKSRRKKKGKSTYTTSVERTWRPNFGIRATFQQKPDAFPLVLEDHACERTLAAVVQPVWIGAVAEKEGHDGGVAVVGC
jgi:hypothetical protein